MNSFQEILSKILLFTLIFLFSCGELTENKEKSSIIKYHSGNNPINPSSPIIVNFNKVPELIRGISEKEKNYVITTQPAIEGYISQTDEKTIVFNHRKPLDNNKEYIITVHLSKLFNNPPDDVYKFIIRTKPITFDFRFNNFIPYHDGSGLIKAEGILMLSGAVDKTKLENAIIATINEKKLNFILFKENNTNYKILVDSIKKTGFPQKLKVLIKGKEIQAVKDVTYSLEIPSKNEFKLIRYNVKKNPELHLELMFSDLIKENQNFDGLIYFQEGTKSKLNVKDNIVKLFPQKKPSGKQTIIISQNLKNINGITLEKKYTVNPYFKSADPEIKFVGKGNILSGNNNWLVQFEAINLKAVDVVVFKIYSNNIKQFFQSFNLDDGNWGLDKVGEYIYHQKLNLDTISKKPDDKWKVYTIDLSKMIKADPGAIYRVYLKFRRSYALVDCNEVVTKDNLTDSLSYYYSNYYYPENYTWKKINDYCDDSYYNSNRFIVKNFLSTDIGLTVKNNGENEYKIFVRDITNVEPLENVKLTLFSYQNQIIGTGISGSDGKSSIITDKKPYILIAEAGSRYGYLKINDGNSLTFSKFDTDGIKAEKGLKGYIFGERGVWRPGDTLHLTFVLQDKKDILPQNYPVKFYVYDALGNKIYSSVSTSGVNGFYVFNVPTDNDASTGLWKAKVIIGNQQYTKKLRVENIMPNRLKISLSAVNGKFVKDGNNKIYLNAKWLTGGNASELKAVVTESIKSEKTSFKRYEEYTFDDPSKYFYPKEENIFEGKLDVNGEASFNIATPDDKSMPGMLKLTFIAKVFEAGGRFSIDSKSFDYAPFNGFVGLKSPVESESEYLDTDKEHKFNVVTLDSKGNPVTVNDIKVEVYKLDWSWWYHSTSNNLASYINRNYKNLVFSTTIKTVNGKGYFNLRIDYPEWGRYFVKVTDELGGHSTGKIVYFDWPSSYQREHGRVGDATLLSLSADKHSYAPGDEAVISFPTPVGAKALISIEKNDKILQSWWINADKMETIVRFDVTEDMSPNVYLYVSVIQSYGQTLNDLPIRSYGLIPIIVNDPATILKPLLDVPETVKPESEYQIIVSEKDNKKMTYVLAVVDEGLLDLTHYKTPSLHSYFYEKEALAVKTWDYYDYIIGAYGNRLTQVFAVGGDNEEYSEISNKKLNRFKPVVIFLGPFTLNKGEKKSVHKFKMPNYVGSVRVMLIAGDNGSYGSSEKNITVKSPLMILASMPRTLMPGETLKLPVTLFVNNDKIKNVKLETFSNEIFSVKNKIQNINVDKNGELITYVDVKVKKRAGEGKLTLLASSGNTKAKYDINIVVRNPNKRIYTTKVYSIDQNENISVKPVLPVNFTENELSFSVSTIFPVNIEKRVQYLMRYPYGCVEQVVSSVFPQLFINKFVMLSENEKTDVYRNVNSAVRKLQKYQLGSGGFGYWPSSPDVDEWCTSYVGNFLTLCKERGYYVPDNMLDNWKSYQERKADTWNIKDKYETSCLTQAYRLYTLALAGNPDMSAMNRMVETNCSDRDAILRLAAAYAITGQKSVAQKLLYKASTIINENKTSYNTYGSEIRNEALALETYYIMNDETKAFESYNTIKKALGSDEWMSTQTTAFALYSVSLMAEKNSGDLKFKYSYADEQDVVETDKPVFSKTLKLKGKENIKIENLSTGKIFLSLETSGIPLPNEFVDESKGLKLTIKYYNMNGTLLNPHKLKQGTDFYAKVEVVNTTLKSYQNIVLSFIVPSGWEILNTRLFDVGTSFKSSASDYFDIKDDRMNIFFSLNSYTQKHYYILLNASYPGIFFQIPVSCNAMYDNKINASKGGGTVEVIN
jgi:uncharacterized protein YfaS (alpha-2-macroglobulin family)